MNIDVEISAHRLSTGKRISGELLYSYDTEELEERVRLWERSYPDCHIVVKEGIV